MLHSAKFIGQTVHWSNIACSGKNTKHTGFGKSDELPFEVLKYRMFRKSRILSFKIGITIDNLSNLSLGTTK